MTGIGHNSGLTDYILISRKIIDHPIVGAGRRGHPYTWLEAWLDLLFMACFKPRKIDNKGRTMELQRGELMGGYTYLANRWNWSVKAVRTFIKRVQDEAMIGRETGKQEGKQKGNQIQIISICNYNNYQIAADYEGQAKGDAKGQAKGKQRASEGHRKNKGNKGNKEKEHSHTASPYDERFEKFWVVYKDLCKKRSVPEGVKKRAGAAWKKLTPDQHTRAEKSLRAYVRQADRADRSLMHCSTYLNGETWETFEESSVPWFKHPRVRELSDEFFEAKLAEVKPNGHWPREDLGCGPGEEGCVFPESVISKLGLLGKYGPAATSEEDC